MRIVNLKVCVVAVMVALVAVLSMPGCDDPAAARNALNAERAVQVQNYGKATDAGNIADQQAADKKIKQIDAALLALNASVNADGKITTDSAISGALTTAGTYLPFPYNLIVGIVGTLIVGGIQEWRVKQKAADTVSVAKAIDAHNDAAPEGKKVESLEPSAVLHLTPGAVKVLNDKAVTLDTIAPK